MADGTVRVVVDYSKVYSAVQDVMNNVTRHLDNNLEIINKNVLATARELDAFRRKATEKLALICLMVMVCPLSFLFSFYTCFRQPY